MSTNANNLRRLMARFGMTLDDVVVATGLCERTVKQLLSGRTKSHPRTLHRLAAALNASVDEFFWPNVDEASPISQFSDEEVREKVERLLLSERRDLLAELAEALAATGLAIDRASV